MKCERARELFSEYLEGSIDYALTATVRAHIDQCDGCRGDLKGFRQTWDVVGTLPEVEPPSSFRHDVVMRAARLQHERRKAQKQGFLGVSWDYVFGRLLPARAIAIACAGALLAAGLLNVPQGIYSQCRQLLNPSGGDVAVSASGMKTTDSIEASPLHSDVKEAWQSRTPLGNALWVSVASTEFCEGNSYYELVLNINNKALVRDVTNRIPVQVYILPPGKYKLTPGDQRKPMWTGNVLSSSPAQLAVPAINNSQGHSVPVTLLITYQFRKLNLEKIVFIPTGNARSDSTDTFNFAAGSGLKPVEKDLYATLQALSEEYGVTIIANASLGRKPNVVDIGADRVENALRKVLEPIGLKFGIIDKAVYVDSRLSSEDK